MKSHIESFSQARGTDANFDLGSDQGSIEMTSSDSYHSSSSGSEDGNNKGLI